MSDDALRLRIMRITNVVKMENFVHVLRDQGMHELAGEAQQALDELRGGDSSSGGPGA